MVKKVDIIVYIGTGSAPAPVFTGLDTALVPGVYRIVAATALDIILDEKLFDDAKLLVIPGGADLPYAESLNGAGNAAIRRFVERGGDYLGLCAGGYYGTAEIAFHAGRPDEISGPRELAFFPGSAIGSIEALAPFYDMTMRSAACVRLETPDGAGGHVYYHGGAYFTPEADGVEVIARYADLPGKPAAAVQMQVGKGRAILTGIHPEVSADDLKWKLAGLTDGASFAHLPRLLAASEAFRLALWHDILARCGLKCRPPITGPDESHRNSAV